MQINDEPLALPLWINGRAYLTMAAAFFDVRSAQSGEILRRVPLCDSVEAAQAVAAAQAALPQWAAHSGEARGALLAALGDALAAYGGHFAALLAEEAGLATAAATAEVAGAVALLRGARQRGVEEETAAVDERVAVVAVVSDAGSPLLAPLTQVLPSLAGGATLIFKPSVQAPSALFALAELSARCGFPAGVVNVLHGDTAAVEGLCASPQLQTLCFAGKAELREQIARIAARHGKALQGCFASP